MLYKLARPAVGGSLILGAVAVAVALGDTGLQTRAFEPHVKLENKTQPTPRSSALPDSARKIEGVILDPDGKPLAGAIIAAGINEPGKPARTHQEFQTDQDGRFNWAIPERPVSAYFVAYKKELAPVIWMKWMDTSLRNHHVERKLGKHHPFSAVLVDRAGKPVAGATVRVRMLGGTDRFVRHEVIAGSSVEHLFKTSTNASGSFAFPALEANSSVKLTVRTADGRSFLVRPATSTTEGPTQQVEDDGFVSATADGKTRVVAEPAACIAGRVFTKLPRVSVKGLIASCQDSHPPEIYLPPTNLFADSSPIDVEGRFIIDDLSEGIVNVFVEGHGENRDWTYRSAEMVRLTSGTTSEVTIELVRGVMVEGTVVARSTGVPLQEVEIGVQGPLRPRSSGGATVTKTDSAGRYRFRLPSGETYFHVMVTPRGFTRLPGEWSSRKLAVPDRALKFEVPPFELIPTAKLRGHVLDANGTPVEGANVVGKCVDGVCRPFSGLDTITDTRGEFRLPPAMYDTIATGNPTQLLIRLRDGAEHEATALPAADGAVIVKLPNR